MSPPQIVSRGDAVPVDVRKGLFVGMMPTQTPHLSVGFAGQALFLKETFIGIPPLGCIVISSGGVLW